MKTWFENIIDQRKLYSGGAYIFSVRTDCVSGTIEFVVHNPLKNDEHFDDFEKARDHYLSLGH